MSQLIIKVIEFYRDVMENKSDPRVKNWFMMSSPFPTVFICLFYVYFSKSLGPKLMKKRKPFDLRNILIVYNFFQFLASVWLFYEVGQSGWLTGYSFTYQPVDYSNDPKALRMANTCWWYYISKFTEFLDTVFFILRKKNNQVSNLHVIHHGVMPFTGWITVKFVNSGSGTFSGFLNTFVHIVMYLYYMIAAMGPNYQKYIRWKKYLTTLQLGQFIVIIIHELHLFFAASNYPKMLSVYVLLHGFTFLLLFFNFYKASYLKKETSKVTTPEEKNYRKSTKENEKAVLFQVDRNPYRRNQNRNDNPFTEKAVVQYIFSGSIGCIEESSSVNVKKRD